MAFIELPDRLGDSMLIDLDNVESIYPRPGADQTVICSTSGKFYYVDVPYERVRELLKRDFYIQVWTAGADTTEEPELSSVESDGETDNADDAGGSLEGLPEAEAAAGHRDAGTVRGQLAEDIYGDERCGICGRVKPDDGNMYCGGRYVCSSGRTSTDGFDDLFNDIERRRKEWRAKIELTSDMVRRANATPLTKIRSVNIYPDVYGWTARCRHQAGLPARRAVYVGFNERVV